MWRARRSGPRPATALAMGAAGSVALAGLAWRSTRRAVVRTREIDPPGWPPALNGLRVAVLSDLHAGAPHVRPGTVRRLASRTAGLRPDLVLLLGDFVDDEVIGGKPVDPGRVAEALAGLRAPLGVFAVLGNHDWHAGGHAVRSALERVGIRVLENEVAVLDCGATSLWLAGLGDEASTRADTGVLESVPDDAPLLVITHSPDVFPRLPARVSLTMAGHTHAGQVRVPLLRRWTIPSRYGDRYAAGHIVEDGRHLLVHPGIGTSRLPVRLGAPAEITRLTLRSSAAQAWEPPGVSRG